MKEQTDAEKATDEIAIVMMRAVADFSETSDYDAADVMAAIPMAFCKCLGTYLAQPPKDISDQMLEDIETTVLKGIRDEAYELMQDMLKEAMQNEQCD